MKSVTKELFIANSLPPVIHVWIIFVFLINPLDPNAPSAAEPTRQMTHAESTAKYYDRISGRLDPHAQPNIAALNQFFTLMPKGGDIHHHFSGAIYVETFLDWMAREGYRINKATFTIDRESSADSITVEQLREDNVVYRQLLSRWSDKDFGYFPEYEMPKDEQFFQTFDHFTRLAAKNTKDGLRRLKERAKLGNVQYLETMLASVGYNDSDPALDQKLIGLNAQTQSEAIQEQLRESADAIESKPEFKKSVRAFLKNVAAFHEGIDDRDFKMRFQTYAYRDSPPSTVFASLYAGFTAANQSDLVVGVNILGPENGVIAIRDYRLHMQMFRFLRERFPGVAVSLHAGELALGMVRPDNLTFHVSEAIRVGGAKRIGHGVGIMYEPDSLLTLSSMVQDEIAVEINLTSNQFILGIEGAKHPIVIYHENGVPLVISTDDPGVSRNNLASQYTLLATRYQFSYPTIKQLVLNSIRYSFMSRADREVVLRSVEQAMLAFESQPWPEG